MARSSTTYTPKWQSGETTVIRVPRVLVGDVLKHARKLDTLSKLNFDTLLFQNAEAAKELRRSKPVNVATVPLRSPFRYPGGKTWLIPYVRAWLEGLTRQDLFIEPFAGGAIASLTVDFEDKAEHVIMAETDEYVAAIWRTILLGQAEWLAEKILRYDLTLENVKKALGKSNGAQLTQKERAFLTILRNRVQRGGIMAPGAGLVKAGEKNKGIKSRWYPDTLARRIRDIANYRDKITFFHGDGFDLLEDYLLERKAAFLSHDFRILNSEDIALPEKYTACISSAHHLSGSESGWTRTISILPTGFCPAESWDIRNGSSFKITGSSISKRVLPTQEKTVFESRNLEGHMVTKALDTGTAKSPSFRYQRMVQTPPFLLHLPGRKGQSCEVQVTPESSLVWAGVKSTKLRPYHSAIPYLIVA